MDPTETDLLGAAAAVPPALMPCPACTDAAPAHRVAMGSTPAGMYVRCIATVTGASNTGAGFETVCGEEFVTPDPAAVQEAARNAALEAEQMGQLAVVCGPPPAGPLRPLRHAEAVEAVLDAARFAAGTPESVVTYLRRRGFAIVATDPAACLCPWEAVADSARGRVVRNPSCPVHGDDDLVGPAAAAVAGTDGDTVVITGG